MDLIVDFPQDRTQSSAACADDHQVSFANEIDIRFVEDLSCKYKDELWFDHQDIKNFRVRPLLMLRALKAKNMTMVQFAEINAHETSAFMGLENFLSEETTRQIKLHRRATYRAVLREQMRQGETGIHDAKVMASVSEEASLWARTRAEIIALMHAEKDCQEEEM